MSTPNSDLEDPSSGGSVSGADAPVEPSSTVTENPPNPETVAPTGSAAEPVSSEPNASAAASTNTDAASISGAAGVEEFVKDDAPSNAFHPTMTKIPDSTPPLPPNRPKVAPADAVGASGLEEFARESSISNAFYSTMLKMPSTVDEADVDTPKLMPNTSKDSSKGGKGGGLSMFGFWGRKSKKEDAAAEMEVPQMTPNTSGCPPNPCNSTLQRGESDEYEIIDDPNKPNQPKIMDSWTNHLSTKAHEMYSGIMGATDATPPATSGAAPASGEKTESPVEGESTSEYARMEEPAEVVSQPPLPTDSTAATSTTAVTNAADSDANKEETKPSEPWTQISSVIAGVSSRFQRATPQDETAEAGAASATNYEQMDPQTNAGDEGFFSEKNLKEMRENWTHRGEEVYSQANAWYQNEENWVAAFYMSCFAMIGVLLRIALAQLFGEECANPGTVGWIRTETPICVTADGETQRQGGIVFSDLPANMLGSFIMGMMQSGASLNLAVPVPIGFLSANHVFQKWDVIHLAIRTGFCGSLTTFSSWNSEMVVMMFSFDNQDYNSQVLRSLFGYIIGVELAIGAFAFGRNAAVYLHRMFNPGLAREADAAALKLTEGVPVNRNLPTFERRYLPGLEVQEEEREPEAIVYLEQWKNTTKEHRRIGNDALLELNDLEEKVIATNLPVDDTMRQTAEKYGWDMVALESWVNRNEKSSLDEINATEHVPEKFTSSVALPVFLTFYALLIVGVVTVNGQHAYSITYRTMMYSALFAPPGALLRWHLSKYNGKGPGGWFPFGTFSANVGASIISIAMIAVDYLLGMNGNEPSFWTSGTCRAIRVGFAGSLSTVSTFIAEVHGFFEKKAPESFYGYYYTVISLGVSCILSVLVYALIVVV